MQPADSIHATGYACDATRSVHKPCVDADSVSPPLVTSSLGDGHSPNVITCVCTRVMSLGSLSTQKKRWNLCGSTAVNLSYSTTYGISAICLALLTATVRAL